MIKAVLLDLDNTLLEHPTDRAIRAYHDALETYLLGQGFGSGLAASVLESVRLLIAGKGRDLRQVNLEIILAHLSQVTGAAKEELQAIFDVFYAEVYPTLQDYAKPVPCAREVYDFLHDEGYAVVIATNPVYPLVAIQERLAWAGLPRNLHSYALVTAAEDMHTVKPEAAYYVEMASRVGVEPDECLMVGDDQQMDILPAQTVGMQTYWLGEGGASLERLYEKLNTTWLGEVQPLPLRPEMIEPEMLGNLAALYGTIQDMPAHYWQQHPDPKEWSPIQIACHLKEVEIAVHRARLERILSETDPFISNSPTPPGPEAAPCDDDGRRVVDEFMALRLETLAWLRRRSTEDWNRTARHSTFGITNFLEMAHFTAQHDRLHINQMCQTLGKCV